ncbi:MAG TPA: ABC transporter substrate-binding protein, partial [Thermomicrobiales bacterium]|nr:ABC transporter substrate-binding protein [Thermomicrobiales bacterium]
MLLATGCVSDPGAATGDEDPLTASEPAASVRPSTMSSQQPPDSPSPGAPPGDEAILTVAIGEPATLDPMLVGDPGSVLVARQLFEGLTRWDPRRKRVAPAAAQSWKVGDGGRRFTFRLRPDMAFHDGAPVTAHDFRFALDRIASRRNASDIAYTLARVRGFTAVNQLGIRRHLS